MKWFVLPATVVLKLFLFATAVVSQIPDFSSFPTATPFYNPSYTAPKIFQNIPPNELMPTNFVDTLLIPTSFLILNASTWVIHPVVLGTSKHFNLCAESVKIQLLDLYNYTSCDEAIVRWNGTMNQTIPQTLIDDYQVPLSMSDLGEWYLFDMCFYCRNTTISSRQEYQTVFYNNTLKTRLWQQSCGGGNNLLLYAYTNLQTICYCTDSNLFATSCNSMQLFWAPLFFFLKPLFLECIALTAVIISWYTVIIPRIVHIIRKAAERKSLERKEQFTLLLRATFTERNWIIVFAELCYMCHIIQPISDTIFYWVVGYRAVKIFPRVLGVLLWFCGCITMINIWIKSIITSIFFKEPKWATAVRVILSILPYIPAVIILGTILLVSLAVKSFQNTAFGISYIVTFTYVLIFSIISIIVGSILFFHLRKGRKDIKLCQLKFTKYLFLSVFFTFCMNIIFMIESLPLFLNYSVTGEWMYMYNLTFVDLIVIIAVTPYMYAAFSFEEWRQCYKYCCPCIPDWNTLVSKKKKKKNEVEDIELPQIETPSKPQEEPNTPVV